MESSMRGRGIRVVAAVAALAGSAVPAVATAQEAGSRAVDTPGDVTTAMLAAAGGVVALFLVATLGRLYQKQRGLHWRFQDPDPVQDDHHGGH